MNVNAKLQSVVGYVRDISNPYARLVHGALSAGERVVPSYQMEEVREATFQSDHACEMIMRALVPRLDDTSAVVVGKALSLLCVLFVEGAAGIRSRVASGRGSLHRIAHLQDVRAGTPEASNRDVARVFLEALDGNSHVLLSFLASRADGARGAESTAPQSQKSEFQAMHEKEQRAYRRQCAEKKKQQSAVIVKERVFGTFNGNLSPNQLVEQVIMSPKKKFARQELDSFVSAAVATGQVPEVCAALDQHLRAGRQTLQNRYKVLLVVEALVSGGVEEAQKYFCDNDAGVRDHLSVSSADNPLKAEVSQCTARRIVEALRTRAVVSTPPPQRSGASSQPAVSELENLFSDMQVKKEPSSASFLDFFLSQNSSGGAAAVDDVFSAPHCSPSVASPSHAPSLTELFDWPRQAGEEMQTRTQTVASENPPNSSHSAQNSGTWQQQLQREHLRDGGMLQSNYQDLFLFSGGRGMTPRQSTLASLSALQGSSAVGGGHLS